MKGKKWISFLVVCICALVSMGILSFYDRVEGNAKSTHDSLERRLEEELPYVAMALLREIENFDIVFLDLRMPQMDGIDVGKEILRRNPGCRSIIASG